MDHGGALVSSGRVVQVNVSAGGVPKLPIAEAWVGRFGLAGDAHHERTQHGGPQRAVCVFAIEAIERLQAEGHPVEPGSVGENLTTLGIEWSTLPVGTRARVGEQLLLEIASSTTPCETQRPNFIGGRFARINIALHPTDSRMYARVLEEGLVRPGDPIKLLPPAPDSRAQVEALLMRIDPVERSSSLKLWAAARAVGYDVRVLDDGDVCAGASRELPERAFNHAHGLRTMPQLLPEIRAHYDRLRVAGLLTHVAPTTDAVPEAWIGVHAATPDDLRPAEAEATVEVERATEDGLAEWTALRVAELAPESAAAWRTLLPGLLAEPHVFPFLARVEGRPAGVGLLSVRRHVGLLRGGMVTPDLRGRGVQRALIAARAAAAFELGCTLVASMAEVDSVSSRNLARTGLPLIDTHPVYRYVPA